MSESSGPPVLLSLRGKDPKDFTPSQLSDLVTEYQSLYAGKSPYLEEARAMIIAAREHIEQELRERSS